MNNTGFINIARVMTTYNVLIERFPDNLKCAQCKSVLKDARQVPCGCRFCCACLDDLTANGNEFCPGDSEDCGKTFLSHFSLDNIANESVSRLAVKCAYDGCGYECQLANIEEHLRECPRKVDESPFPEFGCTQKDVATEEIIGEQLHHENRRHSNILIDMIANINREIETLKARDAETRKIIEILRVKDEVCLKEIDVLKQSDEASRMEFEMTKNDIENSMQEIEKRNNIDEDRITMTDGGLKRDVDMLKELHENSMRVIEKLNKVNEDNIEHIDILKQRDESTRNEIDVLKQINLANGKEIKMMKEEEKNLRKEIKMLKERDDGQRRDVDMLKEQHENSTRLIEKLNTVNEDNIEHIKKLNKANEDNIEQIDILKQRDESTRSEIDELKQINMANKKEIEMMKDEEKELRKEINMLKETDKCQRSDVEMLKELHENSMRIIEKLNTVNEDNKEHIKKLNKVHEDNIEQVDMLKQKDKNIRNEIEIEMMKEEEKDLRKEIKMLKERGNGQRSDVDVLKELYENSMRLIEKLNKVNEDNIEQINMINQRDKNIRSEIDALKQINMANGKEIEMIKEKDEDLRKEIALVLKDRQIEQMTYVESENKSISHKEHENDELDSAGRVIKHVDREIAAIKSIIGSNVDKSANQMKSIRDNIQLINQGAGLIRDDICNMKSQLESIEVLVGLEWIDARFDWVINEDVEMTSWNWRNRTSYNLSGILYPYNYGLASENRADSRNNALAIWLRIYRGPNDDGLLWPFEGRVIITVSDNECPGVSMSISQWCQIEKPRKNKYGCSPRFLFQHSHLIGAGINLTCGVCVTCLIVPDED